MHVYPVVFTPLEKRSGYCVYAPDLKGCITEADNYADGIEKIRDGICGMIFIHETENRLLPTPTEPSKVECKEGDIVTLVDAPMEDYRKRAKNSKAVRKTISLPQWLFDMAVKHRLSLSDVTQKALMNEFGIH